MKKRLYRVAVAGYYGFGNLGDELLLEATLKCLQTCGIYQKEIAILSGNPKETEHRLDVRAIDRWNIKQIWETLTQSDTLLFGGGGLFQDSSSYRSCLYYWGLVRLAVLCKTKVWASGQSIGPLSSFVSRFFTRDALKQMKIIQLRDSPSEYYCSRWNIPFEGSKDLVFALQPRIYSSKGIKNKILINIRPWRENLPERFAEALMDKNFKDQIGPGAEYIGVALSGEDESLMHELCRKGSLCLDQIIRIENLDGAGLLWSEANLALGMRFHFAVLSALYEIPLVAVPYDPKVQAFADQLQVPLWLNGSIPKPQKPVYPVSFLPENILNDFKHLYSLL